ncbi:hypothetical protein FOCC_FOCC008360 [Frankliniella occidentalis]|nr:hypothetical protein FOCC_FOCC008360 [Frankliniella occidentalis]
MIILCTPYQEAEFGNYLEEKVLIDSTHGTNDYDFQLTTLATVHSAGAGVPVMYCISSSVSIDSMTLFFNVAKTTLSKKTSTKVFMSDMAGEFYTAWKNVFGDADLNLFCTWHVDKRWRLKVKEQVKGVSKQAEVYRGLIAVRNVLDKE